MNRQLISAGIATVASLLVATTVLAVGTGNEGGGEAPSATASRVDAVKRYQDGVAAMEASNWKAARTAFADVLEVAGTDANANFMMGMALASDQKFKESRRYFESAVKYSKGQLAEARGWLGRAYIKSGDDKKVAAQKDALLKLKEQCASACKDAAEIDEAIKRIDDTLANPAAAIAPARSWPALAPAAGDAAYLAAAGLINQGRYAEALQSLREAARVFGPHPDILTYEGFANRKLGNHATALEFYALALKLQPQHRGATEYLGEYYVEIGDLARANAQLAKLEAICKFGCEEAYELRRWIEGRQS